MLRLIYKPLESRYPDLKPPRNKAKAVETTQERLFPVITDHPKPSRNLPLPKYRTLDRQTLTRSFQFR